MQLAHIPGTDGWPIVGSTLALLADPKGEVERRAARFGSVYRTRAFGGRNISLLGPEANEFVLFDQAKIFSSKHGWEVLFGRIFPGGLALLDFDEHRLHRRALSVAFKAGPMKAYLASLNRGIADGIAGWRAGPPRHDVLSRDQAIDPRSRRNAVSRSELARNIAKLEALHRHEAAIIAVVRKPIPGPRMARGVKGRAFVVDFFGHQIEARRGSESGGPVHATCARRPRTTARC